MDEARLLELIEGELTGDDAAELRQHVADDPVLAAWVARVRSDREVLRALKDPELPREFLAELEPVLARPMLVEPAGEMNEFQKRHRRQRRAIAAAAWTRRVALAASVVLVAGAGLWAASQFIGGGGPNDTIVNAPNEPRELIPQPPNELTAAAPDADATVHHYAPPSDVRIAANDPGPSDARFADAAALPRGIALVIRTSEPASVESTLASAMTPYSENGALVKNFSFDAAVALDQQLRQAAAQNPGERAEPLRADINDADRSDRPDRTMSNELRRLAERIRNERKVNPRVQIDNADELLFGDRERMPPYEQQLEYSSVGAAYSIAVPGESIDDLLRFLVLDRGLDAQLIALPEPAGIGEQQIEITADQWMQDRPAVAQWLRAHKSDDTAAVPVIVIK